MTRNSLDKSSYHHHWLPLDRIHNYSSEHSINSWKFIFDYSWFRNGYDIKVSLCWLNNFFRIIYVFESEQVFSLKRILKFYQGLQFIKMIVVRINFICFWVIIDIRWEGIKLIKKNLINTLVVLMLSFLVIHLNLYYLRFCH